MEFADDILQEINEDELTALAEFYKNESKAPYIYSFLMTSKIWKTKAPDRKFITFYAPAGNWKPNGTFIALEQFNSTYDFIMFTSEETADKLRECLVKTKRFNYLGNRTLFFAIHRIHYPSVSKAIKEIGIPVDVENPCDIWWMPKEKAATLEVNIPDDVCIKLLNPSIHIKFVNELWPHRFTGSENYLRDLATYGKAYGVFIKENDEIAAWIFKNQLGYLGILQTVEKHKRKGYGSLLVKFLSKEVAEDGFHPLGTVLVKNTASKAMFTKCGFEILDQVTFIECIKVH